MTRISLDILGTDGLRGVKTLEEFYYMIIGIQYPLTPLLITEWAVAIW